MASDYNLSVERRIALKRVVRALLVQLAPHDHDFKLDVLTETIAEVEAAEVERTSEIRAGVDPRASHPVSAGVRSVPAELTAAIAAVAPPLPTVPDVSEQEVGSADDDDPADDDAADDDTSVVDQDEDGVRKGPQILVLKVLADAKGPLRTPEITALVQAIDPNTSRASVHEVLTRMMKYKTNCPIIRSGRKLKYKYTIKRADSASGIVSAHGDRGSSSSSDASVTAKVIEAITQEPAANLGRIAEMLFGSAHGDARKKARDAVYYLERTNKLRPDPDGSGQWEVIASE